MSHNILVTGSSGYLGGTLLSRWASSNITAFDKLFALVRSREQAESVQQLYGAVPLSMDLKNANSIKNAIIDSKITVVIFLIDAYYADTQLAIIDGLSEVAKLTGLTTHFVHVCVLSSSGRPKNSIDTLPFSRRQGRNNSQNMPVHLSTILWLTPIPTYTISKRVRKHPPKKCRL